MIFLGIFTFALGLIVGSGINAFEYRFLDKKSFLKGRSLCPNCKHTLGALDLIPVVSYAMLLGKCRYCKKSISWHYPAIELLTAASFAGYALFSDYVMNKPLYSLEFFLNLVVGLIFIKLLVFLLLYDAKHKILPNGAVYLLAGLGLLNSFFVFHFSIESIALGAIIGFGFFGLMYLLSQGKWIGFGDVKFGLALGLVLGATSMVLCLFLAYIIGSFYAVYILVTHKKKMKDKIAFGPFLSLAGIIALIVGPSLVSWYIGLL
jgi:prepilin signal peptidase PulO-like enzyme (type II secretory pathway)